METRRQLPDPLTMQPEPRVQCLGMDNGSACIVMIPRDKTSGLCYFHERSIATPSWADGAGIPPALAHRSSGAPQ